MTAQNYDHNSPILSDQALGQQEGRNEDGGSGAQWTWNSARQATLALSQYRLARQHLLEERHKAVLRLVADGKTNKEIAGELHISERTVKTHLGHLFEKLGVTSRTEAMKVACRRGLVRLD